MLENSIDAGATQINIVVKDGGLKLMQIQDNGHGIRKEDLAILCHRHTTSKLKDYEDLETIGTFGFRGEALSSISFVSHMTVTTMTADQQHGWRVSYKDGEMDAAGPSPCAAVQGTTISAEDLFYNVPTRRKALKNTADEYARILDMVSRYAVCYAGVGMSCKRQGEARTDVHTLVGASTLDNIRAVYGAPVARDLLPVKLEVGQVADDVPLDAPPALKLQAFVSGMNFVGKRATQLLLFINGRAVEHSMLKRALEATYAQVLPKVQKPFIYMDLRLPPRHVEVNLHPTKKEVGFLNQDEIVELIRAEVERVLSEANHTRTFTQASLPFAPIAETPVAAEPPSTYYRPNKLVRTDPKSQSLEASFLNPTKAAALAGNLLRKRSAGQRATQPGSEAMETEVVIQSTRPAGQCHSDLASIQELWSAVESQAHASLTETIRGHTFVGMADEHWAVVQHGTRLYLANAQTLSHDFFYQQLLCSWGSHRALHLQPPAPLKQLMLAALELEEAAGRFQEAVDGSKEEVAELTVQLLAEKAEMLQEYVAMSFDAEAGCLLSLPLLLEGYAPDLLRLPDLVLRLARDVEWTSESSCFQSLALVLADFYSVKAPLGDCKENQGPGTATQAQSNGEASAPSSAADMAMASDSEPQALLFEESPMEAEGQELMLREAGPSSSLAEEPCSTSVHDRPSIDQAPTGAPSQAQAKSQQPGASRLRPRDWMIQHVLFPAIRAQLRVPRQRASDGSVVQLTSLEKLYRVFERC